MITEIRLCLRHKGRVAVRKGRILFKPRLNVIAGPNGSGKSTLLRSIFDCPECLKKEDQRTAYRLFDAETMNPHRSGRPFTGVTGSIVKVRAMFSSHGETMRDVLATFRFSPGDTLLIDEPEYGHDIGWITRIRKGVDILARDGCQVIIASHHPVFWNKANIIELKKNYVKKSKAQFKKIIN